MKADQLHDDKIEDITCTCGEFDAVIDELEKLKYKPNY